MSKRYIWIVSFLILIVVIVFYLKTRELDQPPGSSSILFNSIEMTDNSFVADAYFTASAEGFKTYSYTIDGDGLHIVVDSCLVNKKYPSGQFDIAIYDDLSSIKYVYIKDGRSEFLVYER